MNQVIELTLEQEFGLNRFSSLVRQMSREQAQEFLIEQQRLLLLREIIYHKILKHEWKLN
jgi:hypothetical protein